jgi:hypothetical protein
MGIGDVILQGVQPNARLDISIHTPAYNCFATDDADRPAVLNPRCLHVDMRMFAFCMMAIPLP